MKYTIDGLFLTQQITGIQRYAYELCNELDKIIEKGQVEILVPFAIDEMADKHIPEYKNIAVVKYGKKAGIRWEQTELMHYLKKNKRQGIFFTNTVPMLYAKGIVTIHDVSYKANPQFFTSKRDRLSALWHRLNYWRVAHSKMTLLTVSEYAKSEIIKYYSVDTDRIHVIYNSWQQMERLKAAPVEETFGRYEGLKSGEYYFAMSTLAPNKNFKWIINAAKQNPQMVFAIAGGGKLKEMVENQHGEADLSNLHLLGYVSDEDAKTLMANCKAFIFPTLYEGFGIPPLEAVACGCKSIVVSDTPCMHEVYGEFAEYLDPLNYNDCMGDINGNSQVDGLLDRYSWEKSAKQLAELL